MNKEVNIHDFTYTLPQSSIALYPLEKRDQSKLLIYDKGEIKHEHFYNVVNHLPSNSLLFFNNTKVIPARLNFLKDTGAQIEIFLLNPVAPSALVVEAMHAVKNCIWKCAIGNAKRWTDGIPLNKNIKEINLTVELLDRAEGIVKFNWGTSHTFAEVMNLSGEVPLPPYLKRKPEFSDKERYQTIYSFLDGAVAAPTAGLHFTEEIFKRLEDKGIEKDFLTLHVSAGTFQPIKTENVAAHIMHNEQVVIAKQTIKNLLKNKFIIPVGTTSMRTLESLYWFGVKLSEDPLSEFKITQHDPYENRGKELLKKEAIQLVLDYMDVNGLENLQGDTSIYIMPGYKFKMCNGLITNFHQPSSTLILLVAAFIGKRWKDVYEEALHQNYRFLSYGDSSLLLP